jgi:hypothetical protein
LAIALVAANGAAATNRDETILISVGGTTLTLPMAASVGGIVYNIRNIASEDQRGRSSIGSKNDN